MSRTEEPPVKEILDSDIMKVISEIFQRVDDSEETRCMKVLLVKFLIVNID